MPGCLPVARPLFGFIPPLLVSDGLLEFVMPSYDESDKYTQVTQYSKTLNNRTRGGLITSTGVVCVVLVLVFAVLGVVWW